MILCHDILFLYPGDTDQEGRYLFISLPVSLCRNVFDIICVFKCGWFCIGLF